MEENLDGTHYYMACVNIAFIRIIIEYNKRARWQRDVHVAAFSVDQWSMSNLHQEQLALPYVSDDNDDDGEDVDKDDDDDDNDETLVSSSSLILT